VNLLHGDRRFALGIGRCVGRGGPAEIFRGARKARGVAPMPRCSRMLCSLIGLAVLAPAAAVAQQSAAGKTAAPKAGKGEKVCRVKLKYSGEIRTWVCKVDEPCCVWHEIGYVKCGSPIFRCL